MTFGIENEDGLPGMKDKIKKGEIKKPEGIDYSSEIDHDVLNSRPSRDEISME